MWTAITIIGIVSALIIIAVRLAVAGRRRNKRLEQEQMIDPHDDRFPEPGTHTSPHRADGSPVPGSEEHRNQHGRP
jgi:hypothetical protein